MVDLDGGQRLGIVGVADGVANLESHTLVEVHKHGAYLAGFYGVLCTLFTQAFKGVKLFDFGFYHRTVAFGKSDGLSSLQGATVQTTNGDTS